MSTWDLLRAGDDRDHRDPDEPQEEAQHRAQDGTPLVIADQVASSAGNETEHEHSHHDSRNRRARRALSQGPSSAGTAAT